MRRDRATRLPAGVRTSVNLILTAASLALASSAARTHGPTPIKIVERIEIAAKPQAVWAIVGDFVKISAWDPAVAASEGAFDERQGKERILTLKGGGKITDALTEYDGERMTYSYRRVDDDVQVFPVFFYSATIKLLPTGAGTEIKWTGQFYRGDTSNDPPENLNDDAARKAMSEFFEAD